MRTPLLTVLITSLCLAPHLTYAQTSSAGGTGRGGGGASRGGTVGPVLPQGAPPSRGQRTANPARPIVPPGPPSAPAIGPFVSPSTFNSSSSLNRDVFQARPRTYAPRYGSALGSYFGFGAGFIGDPGGFIGQPDSSAPALDRYMREGDRVDGYLRLEVEPESAQVYVDGFYAGTVADFRRSGGRALDSGPHRIEFRADGYDSQSVELQIRANDVLSYRGTLNRRDERPELRAAAGPPKTFYVIPRCYAGTSRPRADQLPAGCNLSDLREVPPVVAPAPR